LSLLYGQLHNTVLPYDRGKSCRGWQREPGERLVQQRGGYHGQRLSNQWPILHRVWWRTLRYGNTPERQYDRVHDGDGEFRLRFRARYTACPDGLNWAEH